MVAATIRRKMEQNTKDLVMRLLQAKIVKVVEPVQKIPVIIVGTSGKGMYNKFTVRSMRRVGRF